MATTTLVPNGDVTTTGYISTGSSFYTEIDEGISGNDGDTTKINYNGQHPTAFTTIKFNLSNTPSDFDTPSAVTVSIRAKKVVSDNAQIWFTDDGSRPWEIWNSSQSSVLATGADNPVSSIGATYSTLDRVDNGTITGSKSDWDGAILFLFFDCTDSGMADATREPHITAVDVVCTYTPTGGGSATNPGWLASQGWF